MSANDENKDIMMTKMTRMTIANHENYDDVEGWISFECFFCKISFAEQNKTSGQAVITH